MSKFQNAREQLQHLMQHLSLTSPKDIATKKELNYSLSSVLAKDAAKPLLSITTLDHDIIASDIKQNPAVEVINLKNTCFDNQALGRILPILCKAKHLKTLNMGNNPYIDSDALPMLAIFLPNMPQLQELSFEGDNSLFNLTMAAQVPGPFSRPPIPRDGEKFMDDLFDFCLSLNQCISLKYINFSNCNIMQQSLDRIIPIVTKLPQIAELDFSRNNFNDLSVFCFNALSSTTLKILHLEHTTSSQSSIKPLYHLLTNKHDITIHLQGNFIDRSSPYPGDEKLMHNKANLLIELGHKRAWEQYKYIDNSLEAAFKKSDNEMKNLIAIVFEYMDSIDSLQICALPPAADYSHTTLNDIFDLQNCSINPVGACSAAATI